MTQSHLERRYSPLIILLLIAALVAVVALWAVDRAGSVTNVTSGVGSSTGSGDTYHWKIVTTWPKNLPGLGAGP